MKKNCQKKPAKNRILFIEDKKELVDIYGDFFKAKGYVFISTDNIEQAIELTKREKPDIVLIDIIIPKPENTVAEQGWDYLKEVKKNPETKDIPIIVFSNLDTLKDREKSKKMGAAAYIFKRDCTPLEVAEVIKKILNPL